MAIPLGILGTLMGLFGSLAAGLGKGLFKGAKGFLPLFLEYLKFCIKSSIILIMFLVGGTTFLFIGIIYIYYNLYSKMQKIGRKEKLFFKENSDIDPEKVY